MAPVAYKTCDICRKRKTKCIPATESAEGETGTSDPNAPCTNCTRLQIACTYDHKYKKPGRPSSFAKAAAERDGRSGDSVEPVDAHRRPAETGQRGDESWGGMGMGARTAGNGTTSTSNGTGMAHGGVSAVRSQSFGEAATPSSRPLPGDVDPSQQSLRRLSEVALRRPTEHFLTSTSPFGAPRGLAAAVLPESEGGSAGMNHAGRGPFVPGPATASAPSAPTYTSIPFGPIPNSLAPAYLLPAPPGPAQSTGLTNIDDFDFASAFHHPYDDHDHEDGAENDLAIDWPTMSSGNGTGAAGNATHPGAGVGAGGAALQMALQQDGTAQGGSGGSHPHERTRPNTHTFSTGFSPAQQPGLATLLEQPGGPGTSQLPSVTLQPPSSTTSSIPRPRIRDSDREFQIEDIVPWHTISFFITIYLGYSHSLFPMVHRPSFSQKLALRVDKRDKDFRALVLGIVAYTIGQSPLSRMTGSFTRPELSALQHRCHRGSMMLLDRSFRDPNVLQVATLSAGYFYCQSVGKTTRALTLLSECCQLMHLLHMHDDDATASMGLDAVEIQMRRRIWWHVYAVDITEASAGQMIHLNSFEGQPSFPSEIDDEYLTAQGSFPQPPTHTSYIVGLVACVRLFPVLEQVLVRSRSLRTRNKQARYMTHAEIAQEIEWIAGATAEVDGIMDGLPDVLKMGWAVEESMDEIRLAVMGMQRANMAITAVSIRFALADYKAELQPQSHSADADSASMGREAYHTLSIIPLDDLAANGESMRGKIFRILLALLKSNSDSTDWVATLQDWWTLFSRVQFVQLMTSNVESRLPSPEPGAAA